ncbi:MAG: PAS domain S-box protein [Bacillota bacterium]
MKETTRYPDKPLILVVDDDQTMRLMLRSTLEREGYAVVEAGDGAQALSTYESMRPDLVLMDALLPVMDGFTACTRLKALPGAERTPVLILTGLDDDKSVDMAFDSGATDFISKPVQWAVLRHRVRRLIHAQKTEALLERSEAGAKAVINQALDGIITVDEKGLIQSFNPSAEHIFGFNAGEVIGQHIKILMPGAYREHEIYLSEERRSTKNRIRSVIREISGRRKDGSVFPVQLTISGFCAGEQRLFTVRDITKRKQTESKLLMASKVFENIAEGIMVTDDQGIIQFVNPAFSAITGYDEEEIIGKHPKILIPEERKTEFYREMIEPLQENGRWQGELWIKRKDGELLPVLLSSSAIRNKDGQSVQYIDVLADITEQLRIRKERLRLQERTARIERLSSLGTMSAGICHEINQPLNAIKVLADGMLYWHQKNRPLEPTKIVENLHKISAQAGRIGEIIKHVRSFANLGHITELSPCSLNDAVGVALDMLGRQLSAHGILLHTSLADNLPPISANNNRLAEVVVNLLVNAMQALDGKKDVGKEISCATDLTAEKKVLLEVSDNATGIDPKIMEHIFEPFFTTKNSGEGMGLGLSIVHSIVTGFNGQISVCNNERGGATFRVEFPAIT